LLTSMILAMDPELEELFDNQGDVATSGQILARITRRRFEAAVNCGVLERMWQGIYCRGEPTDELRLRGLDLSSGKSVPVCLGTAAAVYGFDTEDTVDLHALNPPGGQLRCADGLVVHRRDGAPLVMVDGRPVTVPALTAVEVARGLRRPRALATLDAALRSGTCGRVELWRAAVEQAVGAASSRSWVDPAGRRARGIGDGKRSAAGDDRRRVANSDAAVRDHRRQPRARARSPPCTGCTGWW
jgi:hypothetical protein